MTTESPKTFNELCADFRDIARAMEAAARKEFTDFAAKLLAATGVTDFRSETEYALFDQIAAEVREEALKQMWAHTSNWSGTGAFINNFEATVRREVAEKIARYDAKSLVMEVYFARAA